jgi:hypothetical protein
LKRKEAFTSLYAAACGRTWYWSTHLQEVCDGAHGGDACGRVLEVLVPLEQHVLGTYKKARYTGGRFTQAKRGE